MEKHYLTHSSQQKKKLQILDNFGSVRGCSREVSNIDDMRCTITNDEKYFKKAYIDSSEPILYQTAVFWKIILCTSSFNRNIVRILVTYSYLFYRLSISTLLRWTEPASHPSLTPRTLSTLSR